MPHNLVIMIATKVSVHNRRAKKLGSLCGRTIELKLIGYILNGCVYTVLE